jgi:hypothetical protein
MGVDSCWFQNVHGWATNETADWSHDVEFAPSVALCTSGLSSYSNASNSSANTGIIGYTTQDPHTGAETPHLFPGISSPELVGLVPAIADFNVVQVSFYFDVEDASGGYGGVIAMALFQIFFWS